MICVSYRSIKQIICIQNLIINSIDNDFFLLLSHIQNLTSSYEKYVFQDKTNDCLCLSHHTLPSQ